MTVLLSTIYVSLVVGFPGGKRATFYLRNRLLLPTVIVKATPDQQTAIVAITTHA